jgi:hypothetical protein
MNISKPLAVAVALLGTTLFAKSADAAEYCTFYAADSTYSWGPTGAMLYAKGPISFVWIPNTGQVVSGYYAEQVVRYSPVITYFANIVGGDVTGAIGQSLNLSIPSMSFSRTVPDTYSFSLKNGAVTGTPSSAQFTGYLDGNNLITTTGTVVCN